MNSETKTVIIAALASFGIIGLILAGVQLSTMDFSEPETIPETIDYQMNIRIPVDSDNATYRIQFFSDGPGKCELYFKGNQIQFYDGSWYKEYNAGFNQYDWKIKGNFNIQNIEVRFNGVPGTLA